MYCELYTWHYILYTVHCDVYTVQRTVLTEGLPGILQVDKKMGLTGGSGSSPAWVVIWVVIGVVIWVGLVG